MWKISIFVAELTEVGSKTPLFYSAFIHMDTSEKDYIARLVNEIIAGFEREDFFLVEVIFKKGKRSAIHILADTDAGITLKECVSISRKLGALLEEDPEFQFPYTLEVSSPGLDRPLLLKRQYSKNIGRSLKVILKNGEIHEGVLTEVREDDFDLKVTHKKEKVSSLIPVSFDTLKEAKVVISFKHTLIEE